MCRNMLQSIKDQTYTNWHLHVIDDGSREGLQVRPIVEEMLSEHLDKITFDYIPHTPQQKEAQGGSHHGLYMTEALKKSDADYFIFACDDDMLFPDYLEKLNDWYKANPDVVYSYCHVSTFDPFIETPPDVPIRGFAHNHVHDLYGSCTIDASQGSFNIKQPIEAGLHLPVQTRNLDATWYDQMGRVFGLCKCNHIMGQYKAIFSDQMGSRSNTYSVRDKD